MALRWNSQTNRFEDVGDLVGNYQGTNVTQGEFDALKQSGVTEGLAANGANTGMGIGDKVSSWFTPQGTAGTSIGGNVMNAVGTGVGALTGLAGLYYTKKNYDLQKANQQYLQNREAQSDARKSQFAANAGNSATY